MKNLITYSNHQENYIYHKIDELQTIYSLVKKAIEFNDPNVALLVAAHSTNFKLIGKVVFINNEKLSTLEGRINLIQNQILPVILDSDNFDVSLNDLLGFMTRAE